MALTFKWNRMCSLSLAKACFLFGLLDLAVNIFLIILYAVNFYGKYDNNDIFLLIITVVGICTCLLMIIGSKWKIRCLLLPHMLWGMLRVGLITLVFTNISAGITEALLSVVIFCIIWVISFLYWNIMFNRYQEIQEQQFSPPDLVEME